MLSHNYAVDCLRGGLVAVSLSAMAGMVFFWSSVSLFRDILFDVWPPLWPLVI